MAAIANLQVRGHGGAVKMILGWLILASFCFACESQTDKCKKTCYDKVKVCESETDKVKKVRCEAEQTELAIDCANACEK